MIDMLTKTPTNVTVPSTHWVDFPNPRDVPTQE
jgi:hypothetical protein